MDIDESTLGTVLVALADPTRRLVLTTLAEEGQASASKLAERLPVSRQAIIKHLNTLASAGLVHSGRAGREVLYQVRSAPLDESAQWLKTLAARWERRLDAIKHAAENPE